MEARVMKIEKVNINDLISPSYNPRDITPEEMEKLKTSIQEFGYVDPIIVNEVNMHIVGGNQRYEALKELEYEEVDVVYINETDENREKALNIALNKISGEWDFQKLTDLLDELELNHFDVSLTGFDDLDLNSFDVDLEGDYEITDETDNKCNNNDLIEDIIEDEYQEDNIDTDIQYGDLFCLSNHYLLCGDATNMDEINKLLSSGGEEVRVNMIYTDVPYGMGLDTDFSVFKSNLKFIKDKSDFGGTKYKQGEIDNFQPLIIKNIFDLNVNETFLWGADYYTDHLQNINEGSWIVWDKRSDENTSIDKSCDADKMFGSCFELCWSKNRHKREIARVKWAGIFGTETEFDHKRHHPTQKPIRLSAWFINKYSNENDVILDLTAGSGSTLLASEQTNRQCYMMEIDPYYCQVIINRWEEYTGKKAEHKGNIHDN